MSTPALIVVAMVLVVTIVIVVATIVVLVGHMKHLAAAVSSVREEIEPELARLKQATEVTRGELERVSESMDEWQDQRDRSRHR